MNGILYNPAETELDILCNVSETTSPEDLYATTPLASMHPTYTQPDVEELHTSFEEAISDRVLVINKQLRLLSIPLTDSLSTLSSTNSSISSKDLPERYNILKYASRQVMISIAIAFMLVMVGFDLMGLLVLHMR